VSYFGLVPGMFIGKNNDYITYPVLIVHIVLGTMLRDLYMISFNP
jgi:hypothetical protein